MPKQKTRNAKPRERIDNAAFNQFLPDFQPAGYGAEISQWNTLFKNLRWYLLSNNRQLLSQIYVEFGIIATLIDVPVNDALRGGVNIKSEQLDEDDIKQLQVRLRHEGILQKVVGQAAKWNRLFGGAGILVMTDQDYTQPLDISKITKDSPLKFRAADMWELFSSEQNTERSNNTLMMEATDPTDADTEYYDYYGLKVHRSWCRQLKGLEAPSFVRPRLRGWGYSILEQVVRSLNQYLKSNDLSFEVLDEFKLDIFKIKGYSTTLLSPLGQQKVQKRLYETNRQKNYQNALVMDAEDSYENKQLSFTGLAEMIEQIRMQIACDLRMPMSKLFGIPSTGFSSGEDDIEVYNSMVQSDVRDKIEFDVLWIIKILCQHMFGYIPDDLEIEFKPLRTLSSEQEETVKTAKFARVVQARQMGEMDSKEFKDACNKDNLLGVNLDVTRDTLAPIESGEDAEDDSGNTPDPKGKKPSPKSATDPKAAKG